MQGVGYSILCASLQLLFVGLPEGPVCDLMSSCPLVTPYSFVLPLLSFVFGHLSWLGFEMLRSCAPDLSFFGRGGGGDLSLSLSLPCLCCFSLALTTLFGPGTLGFWDFWLWTSFSRLPVVLTGGWELVKTFFGGGGCLFFGCVIVGTVVVCTFFWLRPP